MRFPSVKNLSLLGLTAEQAKELRSSKTPLATANRLMGGYGVESIGLPDGCFDNCQAPDVDIQYVNMGDTYATTLLRVNGSYRVGSWGKVVERYGV